LKPVHQNHFREEEKYPLKIRPAQELPRLFIATLIQFPAGDGHLLQSTEEKWAKQKSI